jgi:hypothetical protein
LFDGILAQTGFDPRTLFTGLPTGMPFPLALMTAVMQKLLGVTGSWSSMTALLNDLSNLGLAPTGTGAAGGWPKTFPHPFSQVSSSPLVLFIRNLAKWLQFDFTTNSFNPTTAAISFIENVLKPQGLLGALDPLTGKLLNSQAPQLVQDLIDQMVSIINQATTVNNPLQVWINAFQSFWSMGTGALSTATSAAAQAAANAAQLNVATGGAIITDAMDYAAGTALSTYTATYSGPGGGGYIPVGDGTIDWMPIPPATSAGGLTRTAMLRTNSVLNTDNGEITVVLPRAVQAPLNGGETYFWIRARVSVDNLAATWARIGYNTVLIGLDLFGYNGGVNSMGFPVSYTPADGDTWVFRFGITAPREFQLLRNGNTLLTASDPPGNAQMGSGNRNVGFGASVGSRNFNSAQTLPSNITMFTAIDK